MVLLSCINYTACNLGGVLSDNESETQFHANPQTKHKLTNDYTYLPTFQSNGNWPRVSLDSDGMASGGNWLGWATNYPVI